MGFAAGHAGTLWTLLALAATASLGGCAAAFVFLRRAREVEDAQLSRLRSAAQGYVCVEGHARMMPGPEILSPLTRTRCVWWQYSIHERTSSDSGRIQWVELESGTSDDMFLIADPTGHCIVDPEHADIVPSVRRRWGGDFPRPTQIPQSSPWLNFGRYRYHERLVLVGDQLYACGWFRTQNAQYEFDESRDVSELLAEWKRDRRDLLRRFDTNRDGNIDMDEWERARQAALEEVRRLQLEHSAQPDLNVLSAPPDGRRYLLSSMAPQRLAQRYRRTAAVSFVLAAVAALALSLLLQRHAAF
jgi:hypothetical protein